jgi:hypothetical protein
MTKRYWVIGGEYEDPAFQALIPGTEKDVRARSRTSKGRGRSGRGSPAAGAKPCATVRYSIAAETVH